MGFSSPLPFSAEGDGCTEPDVPLPLTDFGSLPRRPAKLLDGICIVKNMECILLFLGLRISQPS